MHTTHTQARVHRLTRIGISTGTASRAPAPRKHAAACGTETAPRHTPTRGALAAPSRALG